MLPEHLCLPDTTYQGIAQLHPSSCTPTNKPRRRQLAQAQRQHNRLLALLLVVAEHVNRQLNSPADFGSRVTGIEAGVLGLRFKGIAALVNFELALT
jgi:hypothetical protein